jgi:hypothetical protein
MILLWILNEEEGKSMEQNAILKEAGPYGSQIIRSPGLSEHLVHFQLELLTRKRMPWLLPCCLRYRDGQAQICLNTTGMKPLDLSFSESELNPQQGVVILSRLIDLLAQSADLLLPMNQFSLEPSVIYFSNGKSGHENLCLAFWPIASPSESHNKLDRIIQTISQAFHIPQADRDAMKMHLHEGGLTDLAKYLADWLGSGHPSNIPCQDHLDKSIILRPSLIEKCSKLIGNTFKRWVICIRSLFVDQDPDEISPPDNQTVLLAANPEDFRMAMLAAGKPGTPEESEGLRAYILIDEFMIGRDNRTCDLCLADPGVGRLHARITRRAGSFFITDLGSRNGTRIDGKRLLKNTENLLPDQCVIQFAEQSFYFLAD